MSILRLRLGLIRLIQAGMGVGISSWKLANICARYFGVLGTVSGIAPEDIVTRTLQQGDLGHHMRDALNAFQFPKISKWIIEKYYVKGGIPANKKYKAHSVFDLEPSIELQQLMIASSFCLVWLAKRGHRGLISVNYLEKIQIPLIWYLLGAMLANIAIVTMGAGMVDQIPKVLDTLASRGNPVYKVSVESFNGIEAEGNNAKIVEITFNPEEVLGGKLPRLRRPGLLAIVSSNVLADRLIKKCGKGIIGFVIEGPTAGGHNAPPRGHVKRFDPITGEPLYAEEPSGKDFVDLSKFRKIKKTLGIRFWLAGSYSSPEEYKKARKLGANGVQIGSAFALSINSGFLPDLSEKAREFGYLGILEVTRTYSGSPNEQPASPTFYPFNVASIPGTLSDIDLFNKRKRVCSICALRVPVHHNGEYEYRCPSEPKTHYENKGGKLKDAEFALCLCNALLAAIGLGNPGELAVMTMGKNVDFLRHLMKHAHDSYRAADVINYILPRKYWWDRKQAA